MWIVWPSYRRLCTLGTDVVGLSPHAYPPFTMVSSSCCQPGRHPGSWPLAGEGWPTGVRGVWVLLPVACTSSSRTVVPRPLYRSLVSLVLYLCVVSVKTNMSSPQYTPTLLWHYFMDSPVDATLRYSTVLYHVCVCSQVTMSTHSPCNSHLCVFSIIGSHCTSICVGVTVVSAHTPSLLFPLSMEGSQ